MNIKECLSRFVNNYSHIEDKYLATTGDQINRAPYTSISAFPMQECKEKVSVIIPTWNSNDTLLITLRSIENSSFNLKFYNCLEVVIIDDGTKEDLLPLLLTANLQMNMQYIKQVHLGRAQAINTAAMNCSGEVIIFCDSDIILFPFALEELVKRQQLFMNEAIFFGFREDEDKQNIDIEDLSSWINSRTPAFWKDNRFTYDFNKSWGTNMMLETTHLRNRKGDQNIWVSDEHTSMDDCWQLFRMVYGFLFSVSKSVFFDVGGFDEDFCGWGWEDSYFTAKVLYKGYRIIPCPSSHSVHITHVDRSASKLDEANRNYNVLLSKLNTTEITSFLKDSDINKRIIVNEYFKCKPRVIENNSTVYSGIQSLLSSDIELAKYNYVLGEFERAVSHFEQVIPKLSIDEIEMFVDCLIRTNNKKEYISISNLESLQHTFMGHLASFYFDLSYLKIPSLDDVRSNHFVYCYSLPPESHIARGEQYFKENQVYLALRDFYAAYILNDNFGFEMSLKCKDIMQSQKKAVQKEK